MDWKKIRILVTYLLFTPLQILIFEMSVAGKIGGLAVVVVRHGLVVIKLGVLVVPRLVRRIIAIFDLNQRKI